MLSSRHYQAVTDHIEIYSTCSHAFSAAARMRRAQPSAKATRHWHDASHSRPISLKHHDCSCQHAYSLNHFKLSVFSQGGAPALKLLHARPLGLVLLLDGRVQVTLLPRQHCCRHVILCWSLLCHVSSWAFPSSLHSSCPLQNRPKSIPREVPSCQHSFMSRCQILRAALQLPPECRSCVPTQNTLPAALAFHECDLPA